MSTQSASSPEYQAFLTPQEVSQLLRVSVYTVRRWINDGELPAYKVGRGWRISEADISAWLDRKQSTSASRNGPH
jgi:excisionase family DNA binding protein